VSEVLASGRETVTILVWRVDSSSNTRTNSGSRNNADYSSGSGGICAWGWREEGRHGRWRLASPGCPAERGVVVRMTHDDKCPERHRDLLGEDLQRHDADALDRPPLGHEEVGEGVGERRWCVGSWGRVASGAHEVVWRSECPATCWRRRRQFAMDGFGLNPARFGPDPVAANPFRPPPALYDRRRSILLAVSPFPTAAASFWLSTCTSRRGSCRRLPRRTYHCSLGLDLVDDHPFSGCHCRSS
jgi:hypothetical protein